MTEHYHHGNLRTGLINGGLKMLSRDGIAAFSLRKLSNELGVSHAAAYRHFSSKEDLLRAILIESSNRFNTALCSSVPANVTGQEALMQLGIAYVKFFVQNPEILILFTLLPVEGGLLATVFSGMDATDPAVIECSNIDWTHCNQQSVSSAFDVFKNIALEFKTIEHLRDLTEHEILLGFWGKVHGIASVLVSQKNFIPPNELDAAIERVVRTPF
jgi:AcrR family transcriptional regulator